MHEGKYINRVAKTYTLDIELVKKLDALSATTQIPKGRLIDRALKLLFDELKKTP